MAVRNRIRKPVAAVHAAARGARGQAAKRPILDPIITMNAGGDIQSASDSIEQVFGWTPTELAGRNVKILIPEPRRSDLDRYLDRYRHADKKGTLQRSRLFDALRKDGTAFQIELSVSRADLPVRGAPYFIGIIRDVSHRIEVGVDTIEEHSRMQQLITAQTRALATANLRLQLADRLASIGTLAAGLGHDMNNVLLPVRARLNAIEHAGIPVTALNHVKAVRRSVAYLQHLSDGLHFLAVDPDGPGIAKDGAGTTDLVSWWNHVGVLLRKAVPARVKIRTSIPHGLPSVRIAPHWLTQAMLNLIVNAGEAISVGRRAAKIHIWADTTEDGETVRLGVTDNGRGMTRTVQRRALDLFFTTKARSMGTGLGLPLARKVAVRAGGDIGIKSEPGKGTTVLLQLPAIRVPRTKSGITVKRSAGVTVRDHRAAALVSQVLLQSGFTPRSVPAGRPGKADLWITEPTAAALEAAKSRKKCSDRCIILLGKPSARTESAWVLLGATFIDTPDDFEAIRHSIGQCVQGLQETSHDAAKHA
ncbi:MAG: PAS domain S-box protein [Planctomycetes bacterium]|nr:PAS domain S-box protein [Planctomycetota bacterium]